MRSLLAAAVISLASAGVTASAATVDSIQMAQNDWIVFDFAPGQGIFEVAPERKDGSFSYSYGFSDTLCPQMWACMPSDRSFNTVYMSGGGDFGYGWNPQSFANIVDETVLTGAQDSKYMFFRVTSGNASISRLTADVSMPPAPVPLPATGLLLLGGLGGLVGLQRYRSTTHSGGARRTSPK